MPLLFLRNKLPASNARVIAFLMAACITVHSYFLAGPHPRLLMPLHATPAALHAGMAAGAPPTPPLHAQGYDLKVFAAEMRWRSIGPYRGGRAKSITGVPGQPNVFYTAFVNGGVWKTTDYGRTWTPIFDDQPTGSIGAVAVAPSDPNVLYVGSGEGLQRPDLSVGDGIYKSTDGARSWRHVGLRDGQQIPAVI